ncbi:MAG: sigma-70 family RNA polymerase sigma factor [Planctomycetota bacterium]
MTGRSTRGASETAWHELLESEPRLWLERVYRDVCPRVAGALVRRGWSEDDAWDVLVGILSDFLEKRLAPPTGGGALGSWIFVVARRRLISAARRRAPQQLKNEDPDPVPDPLERLLVQEQADLLHAALKELTIKEHEALVGRFVEGLRYSELAERMVASEGTIRKRVFEARRKLERWL